MPSPAYDISSLGNYVVTSGPNGTAQLFKINSTELGYQGKGVEQFHECSFSKSFEELPISPPKQMIRSARLNYAAFEPCAIHHTGDVSIRRVAGIQSSSLYLYDIPSSRIVGQESFGNGHINKFEFSRHALFGQLMAICSQDSSIGVVDTRLLQQGSKSLVWNIKDAHQGQVMDISFNTFIPFWIASGGEDGVVKMWDLRYLKNPAARIDAHYGSIKSLAWSNTHCNILSSVSHDRSWRSWYIDGDVHTAKQPWKEFMIGCPGSEYEHLNQLNNNEQNVVCARLIGDFTRYEAPVIAVQAATMHADTFYSVSSLGVLSAHTIKSRVVEGLLHHRYENNYEKEVETAIQNRNLAEAFEVLIKLSRTEFSKNESIANHEGPLIDHCAFRKPIDESEWKIGDRNSLSLEEVQQDLKDFTYGLPPGFEDFQQWIKIVPEYLQIQFDLVRLRYKIVSEINKGNWQVIVENEKKILTGMEIDDEFLDIQTIQLIVHTILVRDFAKGLSIGLALGQLLADIPKFNFESLSNIMSLLIYPTVYDNHDWILDKDMELMRQNGQARQLYVQRFLENKKTKQGSANPIAAILRSRVRTNTGPRESPTTPQISGRKTGDEDDAKSPKKLIKSIVGDGKAALPMVSLEMRILKLIETPPEEFNEEVIRVMQNVLTDSGVSGNRYRGAVIPFERTISLITNKLYLSALMETKRYEEYFGVAYNLIVSYNPYEFSKSILRQMDREGFPSTKLYLTSMASTANSQLNAAQTQGGNIAPQTLVASVKLLKDCIVIIVKITAFLMDGIEVLKADKDICDTFGKICTSLTALMSQMTVSLFKTFETFEKVSKVICKEFAHTVHDSLRDAARNLPLSSNKSRPVTQAEKASNGMIIQEEAFSTLEKLYKGYLKNDI